MRHTICISPLATAPLRPANTDKPSWMSPQQIDARAQRIRAHADRIGCTKPQTLICPGASW